MVTMRIQRHRTLIAFTALKDCEPPLTCITASVRPYVGRTAPTSSGNQSIWLLKMPVIVPWRLGLHHTRPSDHCDNSCNSATLGWSAGCQAAANRKGRR